MRAANKYPARPVFWITCFYMLGVWLAHYWNVGFGGAVAFSTGTGLVAFLLIDKSRLFIVAVALAFTGAGFTHAQSDKAIPAHHIIYKAKYLMGKETVVRGKIVSDIQQRQWGKATRYSYRLKLTEVNFPWGRKPSAGIIVVNSFEPADISFGDVVELKGKLHRPFNFESEGNFLYEDYLKTKNIYFLFSIKKGNTVECIKKGKAYNVRRLLLELRRKLKTKLSVYLSGQERGLMEAVLLGERGGISSQVNKLFERTGTVHILAISGLNITIVSSIIFLLIGVFPGPRSIKAAVTIVIVLAYACLTGGSPSVVRSAIMFCILLASFILEKDSDSFNTLALTALIILLYQPAALFDIGFQLSFVCVATILFFLPFLKYAKRPVRNKQTDTGVFYLFIDTVYGFVAESLIISTAVWFVVAGFIVYYFGIVTPVTILANIFIVPIMCAANILGMGLIFAAFVWPYMAECFAACITFLLNITVALTFIFSKIPYAYFYCKNINIWPVIIYYVFILFILAYFQRVKTALTLIDKENRVC